MLLSSALGLQSLCSLGYMFVVARGGAIDVRSIPSMVAYLHQHLRKLFPTRFPR
jgi:hypothetical protein